MIGALPDWPAMMKTDAACAYVSLSESSFQALAASNGVRPVDLGPLRGVRWKRADLDRLIDSLPNRDGGSVTEAPSSTLMPADSELAHQALARVASRSAGRAAR
jgi:hypothetical protein